ncbi:MAG: hypothetical protein ACJ8GN_23580 [Longimicrobiaceae bacterium]
MKLHILGSAAALALAAAAPSAARAQAEPGDMVRVWAGQGRQEGIVVAAAADSLRLFVFRSDTVALAWTEVRRIDVSQGRESPREAMARGAVRGLAYGAAAGAVTGFIFGGSFCRVESLRAPGGTGPSSRGCGMTGRWIGAGMGAAGGGVIGLGAGVVYGSWKPRTRWKRARAQPELAVGAAPGGMALELRLRH